VTILFGSAVTLFAVLLSDLATKRYMSVRESLVLFATAVLESVGYRQVNAWWGCVGTAQALRGGHGWGVMKRRAFET